ncbi:unnamed protein product [Mytilus coruscus]|uniref:Reverse transcriptase domain-containing protein n=1 Tax=Mytilus coruscus TaxID=42192 RepID=A0A6J8A6X3_MYTCO|nr:unnamed protein product [Mytilus coruscus]
MSDNERCKLQENLDSLCEWSNTWKLKFNAAKCKVLHINPDNDQQYRYTMLDDTENFIALSKVNEEKDLGYEDRFRSLGLPTLEYRRDRNDMIQVYKALHGIDDINWMSLFTLAPSNNTRGHSLKLFKKQCKTTHRLNTFSIRVVDQWNNLSDLTVTAKTLNNFKSSLNGENWNLYKFICSC